MGDRGNIVLHFPTWTINDQEGMVRDDDQLIFLYTHWHGSEMPEALATILSSKPSRARRGDETYQARIIAQAFFEQTDDRELGFGLGPYPADNEHTFIHVGLEDSTVWFGDERTAASEVDTVYTFDQYLDLTPSARRRLFEGEDGDEAD